MKIFRFSSILAAALFLTGGGCVLGDKIGLEAPWSAPEKNAASNTESLNLEAGFAFTARPSALGVTGTIDAVLGEREKAIHARLLEAHPGKSLRLEWSSASASGTLELDSIDGSHAMLLPAFWPIGVASAGMNGGVWLSPQAYDALQDGEMEWRLGLADNALSGAVKALKTFNNLSKALTSATAVPISPYAMKKTGAVDAFPLFIDGKLSFVRAVRASGWFADMFILDNRANPLILKVIPNPIAQPALQALSSAQLPWNELGYEITSVDTP